MGGQDAIALSVPLLTRIQAGDGVWDTAWMGGTKLVGVYGDPLVLKLLLGVGASPVAAFNAVTVVMQVCTGFLCIKTGTSLRPLDEPHPAGGMQVVLLTWLTAFAPVLAWRVAVGHINLALATAGFLAGFALLACARARRLTAVVWVVAGLALQQGIQTSGQQILLYCLVFGTPVLVAALLLPTAESAPMRFAMLVGAAALLVAVANASEILRLMLANVTSSDAARSLDNEAQALLRSHTDWNGADAAASWFWSVVEDGGRPSRFLHETQYAVGPPLVLAAAYLARRAPRALVLVVLALTAAALFALDVDVVVNPVMAAAPFLGAFRVPARMLLPLTLILTLLALPLLNTGWGNFRRHRGPVLLIALVPLVLPGTVREVLTWAAVALLVYAALGGLRLKNGHVLLACLPVLAGCSLGAFRERMAPLSPESWALDVPLEQGARVRAAVPALDAPLARVATEGHASRFGPNSAIMHGLGSLDGYGHPPRRFAQLYAALNGDLNSAGRVHYELDRQSPAFLVLAQLYNLGHVVSADEEGRLVASPLLRPLGPAWFSRAMTSVGDLALLAETLRAAREDIPGLAARAVLLNARDARSVSPEQPLSADCSSARVERVRATTSAVTLDVKMPADGPCPLTISVNYLEILGAAGSGLGITRELVTFPGYGSLLGVVVEPGISEVSIRVRDTTPAWTVAVAWLGMVLWLAPLLLIIATLARR